MAVSRHPSSVGWAQPSFSIPAAAPHPRARTAGGSGFQNTGLEIPAPGAQGEHDILPCPAPARQGAPTPTSPAFQERAPGHIAPSNPGVARERSHQVPSGAGPKPRVILKGVQYFRLCREAKPAWRSWRSHSAHTLAQLPRRRGTCPLRVIIGEVQPPPPAAEGCALLHLKDRSRRRLFGPKAMVRSDLFQRGQILYREAVESKSAEKFLIPARDGLRRALHSGRCGRGPTAFSRVSSALHAQGQALNPPGGGAEGPPALALSGLASNGGISAVLGHAEPLGDPLPGCLSVPSGKHAVGVPAPSTPCHLIVPPCTGQSGRMWEQKGLTSRLIWSFRLGREVKSAVDGTCCGRRGCGRRCPKGVSGLFSMFGPSFFRRGRRRSSLL